ncbi:C1 family peptidase [Shouchella lonarensis]|uniref:Papain family cysteine protease n=1 Tax=Shouchella lonarensis TaxID=1464122 RepID=A0A1G6HET6_9BACI|nr:C1 family peptidase [Shouchella lonarensis]SDB92684.1 Papain family cysteine protease [Shouchella lonarensis]
MKRFFVALIVMLLALSGVLFEGGQARAEQEKPFDPNDFSTYGTGLKDSPPTKDMEPYVPEQAFVTEEELKKRAFSQDGNGIQVLPSEVDLRPYFAPVRSQGPFGTCVAFATTGLREYYIGRATEARGSDITHLSPGFIYYPSGPDDGMHFYTAFDILRTYGVPPESERPFDLNRDNTDQFQQPHTPVQRENALPYRINGFRYISGRTMVDQIKQAVANGNPVMAAINVYPNFDATPKSGITPPVEERKSRGGHAVVVTGYDEENEWFIVRNSWGTGFGDGGYAYIKYDILRDLSSGYSYVADVRTRHYPPQGVNVSTYHVDSDYAMLSVSAMNVDQFELYRDGELVGTFRNRTVINTGLEPDKEYTYHVVAKNGYGKTRSMNIPIRTIVVEETPVLEEAS